jgi:TonB family protein
MTASDGQGQFTFTTLAPGEYELKAVKRGFEVYQAQQILEAGRGASHDLQLKVATVTFEDDVVPQGAAKGVPPSEPGGKTTRVRVGGDLQAPKLVNKVQPVYPEQAKAAGSQGMVILRAVIGKDGTPLSLRVVNDQIDPQLARAAIESVSKWRYTPTLLNGEPIEVDTTIQVNFTLQP